MAEHTPGPWDVELDEKARRVKGILGPWTEGSPDGGVDIEAEWNETYDTIVRWRCRVVETDSGYYPPRIDDARLIAAAPDLLAACQLVLSTLDGYRYQLTEDVEARLREAVEKALYTAKVSRG